MIAPDRSLKIRQYTMAGELFTRGFPSGGGPCRCSAACCEGGVSVDVRERDAILAHRELIASEMDETQVKDPAAWFATAEQADPDFPSGVCVDTKVINEKCAFLDSAGRCVLQSAAIHAGMHPWAFKPLYCVLYPIEISAGVVSFDEMLQDEQECCSVTPDFGVPLYQACREELVHLVGEEGYGEMDKHYAALQRQNTLP
jgi:Fe-S-cluster containining protein